MPIVSAGDQTPISSVSCTGRQVLYRLHQGESLQTVIKT